MATLYDAIKGVQDIVGAVSGIRAAPDEPPANMSMFPFAVAYASEGEWEMGAIGTDKGLHQIVVEVHVTPNTNLARSIATAMPYGDLVGLALLADPTLGGAASTFGGVRYKFGVMRYGGKETMGWRFFLEGVKVQVAASR